MDLMVREARAKDVFGWYLDALLLERTGKSLRELGDGVDMQRKQKLSEDTDEAVREALDEGLKYDHYMEPSRSNAIVRVLYTKARRVADTAAKDCGFFVRIM